MTAHAITCHYCEATFAVSPATGDPGSAYASHMSYVHPEMMSAKAAVDESYAAARADANAALYHREENR